MYVREKESESEKHRFLRGSKSASIPTQREIATEQRRKDPHEFLRLLRYMHVSQRRMQNGRKELVKRTTKSRREKEKKTEKEREREV